MNVGTTKANVSGADEGLIEKSGEMTLCICRKRVGSNLVRCCECKEWVDICCGIRRIV